MLETIIRVTIAITVMAFVYFLLEAVLGRAVGKLILGLRIAGEDARPASVPRLLLRTLIKTAASGIKLLALGTGAMALNRVGNLVGVVVVGGCLLVLWPRRQALHDLAARTAVFHASDVVEK